jgi:hypothetical protein
LQLHDIPFSDLLNTPTAFLLQQYPKEQLFSLKDSYGFTLFHRAVSENNIMKVAELLSFNFPYTTCSYSNILPDDFFIEFKNINKKDNYYSIPFSKNGYSAIHLSIFLHNFYQKSDTQSNFKNNKIANIQKQIIEILLNHDSEIFSIQDHDGFSVLDYCFLLEDISLIELGVLKNPSMIGLNKVTCHTALQILDSIELKNQFDENNINTPSYNSLIKEYLLKKINYEALNIKLSKKNVILYKKTNKI